MGRLLPVGIAANLSGRKEREQELRFTSELKRSMLFSRLQIFDLICITSTHAEYNKWGEMSDSVNSYITCVIYHIWLMRERRKCKRVTCGGRQAG